MDVTLEAIKFNHDPTSASNDAFNIRRNETEPVIVPEWRRGISVRPEDSPAAYARDAIGGNRITIEAKFTCGDQNVSELNVQAIDGQHGNASFLGEVESTPVTLINGESGFVRFTLNSPRFVSSAIGVNDVTWRWQYWHKSNWIDFATTAHRIYTVLAAPTCPWQPTSSDNKNTQQPWTDVLDRACDWGAGAHTTDEAATLITKAVNDLGKSSMIQYDLQQSGSAAYVHENPASFDCADFLNLLRGTNNLNGKDINCDDCAAIVATFCNAVGCDLFESSMAVDFGLNFHELIGHPNGPHDGRFSHHTVAWKSDCREDDTLFDACVRLDSDDKPAEEPHPLMVPTNIRFGQLGERAYRFRLVKTDEEAFCFPVPDTTKKRRIVGLSNPSNATDCSPVERITFGPQGGKKCRAPRPKNEGLFISGFRINGNEISNFRLEDQRLIHQAESAPIIQSFWSPAQNSNNEVIRLEIYESPSFLDGYLTLLELAAGFALPNLNWQQHANFGDAVFSIQSNFVILFSRGNLVFQLRNVGATLVSCEATARIIDNLVKDKPQCAGEHKTFSLSDPDIEGRHRLLEATDSSAHSNQYYKFYTNSGEVSFQEGQLTYKDAADGPGSVEVFVMDSSHAGWHQVLTRGKTNL